MYDVNLYPPIFDQPYMPAFIYTGSCQVYFRISDLNVLDDIHHDEIDDTRYYTGVQVAVRKQKDNQSALIDSYTNDIMLKQFTDQGQDLYHIPINSGDIKNGFQLNQYYKVQIRFLSNRYSGIIPDATTPEFGIWLANNAQYFSQWSTVALIRGISEPDTSVHIKENNIDSTNDTVYVVTDRFKIVSIINFGSGDTERLEKYRVKIYEGVYLRQDSGEISTRSNTVTYIPKKVLKKVTGDGARYTIKIFYTSTNGYEWDNGIGEDRFIDVVIRPDSATSDPNITMTQTAQNTSGRVKISINRNVTDQGLPVNTEDDAELYYAFVQHPTEEDCLILESYGEVSFVVNTETVGYTKSTAKFEEYWQRMLYLGEYSKSFFGIGDIIIIRRTSSLTNFSLWDQVASFSIRDENISELTWYDYTAEPGVWYKYQFIKQGHQGDTIVLITNANSPVMLDTEDIFLGAGGEELIVKFDPSISNMTNKVAESIVDTIGSQYPFIRKNGNVNYKTFSLSGTISYFMDVQHNVFNGSRQDIYGSTAGLYNQYNDDHRIGMYNDMIFERHFRDKVIKFLQSNNIKLFRSLTEGNMLVKLSNITFAPNQTLGRMIYNFSCTAYEVAECNKANYDRYKITKNTYQYRAKEVFT